MIKVGQSFKAGDRLWIATRTTPNEVVLENNNRRIHISIIHNTKEKYLSSGKIIKHFTKQENKMCIEIIDKLKGVNDETCKWS